MNKPIYRQALLSSWHLVWHNKFLWILGICSIILGQWGLGDFIGQMNLFVEEGFGLPPTFRELVTILTSLNFDSVTAALLSLWFFVLVAVFVAAVVFIAVVSRGALIAVTSEWYYDRKRIPVSEAWHDGVKSFWPLFCVTLINRLLQAVVILFFANFLIGTAAVSGWYYGVIVFLALLLSLFLVVALEAVTIYASGYIVLERVWFGKAVRQGWDIFRSHKFVSLELGVLLMLISFGLFGVMVLFSVAVLIPFLALWFAANLTGWYVLITIGLILATMLFIIGGIIAGGVFNAFTTTSWVYLFMKMHHEGIGSRVKHHLRNWLNIK